MFIKVKNLKNELKYEKEIRTIKISKDMPFKIRKTEYGDKTITEHYSEVHDMDEFAWKVERSMFKDYKAFAQFLIACQEQLEKEANEKLIEELEGAGK